MWIVCITSVRHVLTVNGYGGRQTKENEKSWCFKGWETLVKYGKEKKNKDKEYFTSCNMDIDSFICSYLCMLSFMGCTIPTRTRESAGAIYQGERVLQ